MAKKKGQSVGQTLGGIIVGFDQQIFRTTPPVSELVAKGTPLRAVAASGGGTLTVGMPDDPAAPASEPATLVLTAPSVELVVYMMPDHAMCIEPQTAPPTRSTGTRGSSCPASRWGQR